MKLLQRTIKREVIVKGIGVSTGEPSAIKLIPSGPNTGICFISSQGTAIADLSNLGDSDSNTSLNIEDFSLGYVEHLLSCLYGLFIDNVKIEVIGKEIPIGDGSAKIFYEAINRAGIEELESARVTLHITKRKSIGGANRRITITPAKKLIIDYSIDWHPVIKGKYSYTHKEENYKNIAFARTFAERSHVERVRIDNKAKGLKMGENCIDIDSKDAVKSKEYVKHKILDLLGDISLVHGLYIQGKITAVNAGHKLHHELAKRIIE